MLATVWIVLAIVTGIALDIYLSLNRVPNYIDSISSRAKVIGWYVPTLPFGVSMLVSHFWINVDHQLIAAPYDYYLLAACGLLWGLVSFFYDPRKVSDGTVRTIMVSAILSGLIAGILLWPQRPPSLQW